MLTGIRNILLASLMTCLCLVVSFGAAEVYATDKNVANALTIESTHRIIISHPIVIKEGGSLEEVLSLARLWRTNVADQIPDILKTEFLLEEKSKKEYVLLMIYYFKDKGGEIGAMGKMGEAMRKSWPDQEKLKKYFADLDSYIDDKAKTTGFYSVLE